MQKTLRKLCVIPVLLLALAAVTGLPETAAADEWEACLVHYWGCPPDFFDCCCGFFQSCWVGESECARICG
jgi:hypothetical protein